MQETKSYVSGEQITDDLGVSSGLEVFEDVVSRRRSSFYRTAHRFLGNPADAEDAVQDALLSAYKHLHQFKGQSQMSTWITSIVTNSARMQLRRQSRRIHMSLDEPLCDQQELSMSECLADNRPSPEDKCQIAELQVRLRDFVTTELSPTLRTTFQLRELQGLSARETAGILRMPVGTVKAQLSRARAKLTRRMRRSLAPQQRPLSATRKRKRCLQA